MTRSREDSVLALPLAVRCRRLHLMVLAVEQGGLEGLFARTGLWPNQLRALLYTDPLSFTGPVARGLEVQLDVAPGSFDQPPPDVAVVRPLWDCRADNLRRLAAEHGGAAPLARRCGASAQTLQQLLRATRDTSRGDMPDALLRTLEAGCGKPTGWMDEPHPPASAPATPAARTRRAPRPRDRACEAAARFQARERLQAERLADRVSAALVRSTLDAEAARERAWRRSLEARRRTLEQAGAWTEAAATELDEALHAPIRLANACILWHEAGGSWRAVAARCGMQPDDLALMLARGLTAEDAACLEQGLGKPAGWMHALHEAEFADAARARAARFDAAEHQLRREWLVARRSRDAEREARPVRRDNLALLVLRWGGTVALATRIGRPRSMVSSWTSRRDGSVGLSSDSARHVERCCGLPEGWMDRPRAAALVRATALVERRREHLRRLLGASPPSPAVLASLGLDARGLAMRLRVHGGTPIPDDLARRLEAAFGRAAGYLDRALVDAAAVAAGPPSAPAGAGASASGVAFLDGTQRRTG